MHSPPAPYWPVGQGVWYPPSQVYPGGHEEQGLPTYPALHVHALDPEGESELTPHGVQAVEAAPTE
jgi:hypothetical protein